MSREGKLTKQPDIIGQCRIGIWCNCTIQFTFFPFYSFIFTFLLYLIFLCLMYLKLLFVTLNLNHMYQLYQVLQLHKVLHFISIHWCISYLHYYQSTNKKYNRSRTTSGPINFGRKRQGERDIYIYNNQISIALSLKSSFCWDQANVQKNQEPLVVPSILEESAKEKDVYM